MILTITTYPNEQKRYPGGLVTQKIEVNNIERDGPQHLAVSGVDANGQTVQIVMDQDVIDNIADLAVEGY